MNARQTRAGANDEQGRAHMQQVEKILQRLEPAPRIAILEPADVDLRHKEDVVDYVKQLETAGNDTSQIQAAILEFFKHGKTERHSLRR